MEPVFIEARDISDAWFLAIVALLDRGYKYKIQLGSYAGQERLEFDHITIRIKYPGTRPLLPEISPVFGIPNPASEEYLDSYIPYLMVDYKEPGEDYTYGQFVASQVEKIITMFNAGNFATNQACITVGDTNSINLEDTPCLKIIDCRVKDGKLHFIVYFRSNDLWGGFPVNVASLQILKEYICQQTGLEGGEIIYSSKGLHLYDHVWEHAKTITMKE